ncbi:MAG: proteasome-type protease, partial [Pseudomonadota bacterium]
MTYCIGIRLNAGLVLLADTRTNAGVDNISRFRKLFTWSIPGERAFAMLTSGNLATTQAVISLLQERMDRPQDGVDNLMTAPSMFRMAELVGGAMREVQNRYAQGLSATNEDGGATIVLAGHRTGGQPRLFMIYPAGNFIEATPDSPYFQIGEHKYGKPILDRVITPDTTLEDAKTAALLSMDSTLRSNLTVGMPLDLAVLSAGSFTFSELRRIEPDDPHFHALSHAWSEMLLNSFHEARERAANNV